MEAKNTLKQEVLRNRVFLRKIKNLEKYTEEFRHFLLHFWNFLAERKVLSRVLTCENVPIKSYSDSKFIWKQENRKNMKSAGNHSFLQFS